MNELKKSKCEVCRIGAPQATEKEIAEFKTQVPDWQIVEEGSIKKLMRKFKFADFKQTLSFVNKIGDIAEQQGHHPLMLVGYNSLTLWWWTHKINGLHKNDFIMAAKTDELIKTRYS